MQTASQSVVDKSQQRVRTMFAEIAGRYDLMNHLLSMNVDRYWRWMTVRRLRPEPGWPMLDVCTGTGDLALAFCRATGGQVPVVGADFCRPMLARAVLKKLRHKDICGQLTFVEADALALPFADEQFQVVVVAFGLRNLEDTEQGLQEMWRVCRPGGRLGILEFSMPARQPLRGLYGIYFRHILPRLGQVLARNRQSAYSYLPASVGQFPSGEELSGWLRGCGWTQVRFEPLSGGIATLYTAVK